MEVKDYCDAMLAEVTAWKEKLEAMKNEPDDLFGAIGSSVDRAWRDLEGGMSAVEETFRECNLNNA